MPNTNKKPLWDLLRKSAVLLAVALVLGGSGIAAAQNAPPVVCIDPGHPSEVGRGTSGKHLTEMAAAWDVANRLAALLEKDGVKVVMTKTSESQFVTNIHRADIANDAHAAFMVRLHCDGGNNIGSGFAVYYPDRQGRAHGKTGPDPSVIAGSHKAALALYEAMQKDLAGQLDARGLHPDTATRIGAMQGALTGSIFAKEPVALVEMCVLTNPRDEAWMSSDSGQQQMAQALADGVLQAIGWTGR